MTTLRALLAVSLALAAGTARAERFTCGRVGGVMTYGLEANIVGLDQPATSATSSRDAGTQIYEALVTRDENMRPLLLLAQDVTVSPDNRVFKFRLRDGVRFHNGKLMTSEDVLASFERYKRMAQDRSILEPVASWEIPDAQTFTITLKDPFPTFLESMSSVTVPIIIVPKENSDAPAMQLKPVGTGPFQVAEFVPNSFLRLKRFEGYAADTRHDDWNGFGGYKVACVDEAIIRMATEPGARVAGLQTGELQAVQDVPVAAQQRLAADPNIKLQKMDFFWINVSFPNWSAPPTNNLKFRQAVQAALDLDEIMDAATDGLYRPVKSLQIPGSQYYSEAGAELLNQHNPEKAKQLLKESGYAGEKVVMMTSKDYLTRYNSALVMAQQLQAIGINAELMVLDWPTALQKSMKGTPDWNYFYTGWMTYIAQGGQQTLRNMAEPAAVYDPPGGKVDERYMKLFRDVAFAPTQEERVKAFADAQRMVLEQVMIMPLGVVPKVQGMRANVEHYKPYWSPRLYNVWLRP